MLKKDKYDYHKGMKVLKQATKSFPNGSGIYKFLDDEGGVLYVGKAKNLKKRISSYVNSVKQTTRIKTLVSMTESLEFIKTHTELDSFILENNLIKELKPRFNIRLMDDKSYPYICISESDEWPRIRKFRGKQNKNDVYFGPFANSNHVDEVIRQLERAFLLRSCSDNIFKSRKRACILFQIKRCSAPCVSLIDNKKYSTLVKNAILFLKGKNTEIKKDLIDKMKSESKNQNFEEAAIIRDRIKAISKISFEQYSDLNTKQNFDIVFLYNRYDQVCIQVFFYRAGKNLGHKEFILSNLFLDEPNTILTQFLIFYYTNNLPPNQILINQDLKEIKFIKSIIYQSSDIKVTIKRPKIGKKLELLKIVEENIKAGINEKNRIIEQNNVILTSISNKLNLENIPKRIEVYDNSHFNGSNPVGAMVVFKNNNFQKSCYRKFNIKTSTETSNDDYLMLQQVLNRRFNLDEDWKKELPDLVIIDGGKGQLNIANKIFKEKKINNIDFISIAKGKKRNAGNETIYSNKIGKYIFSKNDKELFFLQRLRDEAHRFAITSQKKRRLKKINSSIFDNVFGIGKETKSNLLLYFGSIENIKTASIKDLKKVPGIGNEIAEKIYKEFNKIV